MKGFFRKGIFNKIVIVLIAVIVFSLINPVNVVEAKSWLTDGLGNLLDAIMQFLMMIADAVMDALQKNFISKSDAIIQARSGDFSKFNWTAVLGIIIGVLVAVVGIILAIPSGGASAAGGIAAAAAIIQGVCVGAAVAVGGAVVTYVSTSRFIDDLRGDFDIPMFAYTPYTIFSGQVPAFDINFIKPMESYTISSEEIIEINGTKFKDFQDKIDNIPFEGNANNTTIDVDLSFTFKEDDNVAVLAPIPVNLQGQYTVWNCSSAYSGGEGAVRFCIASIYGDSELKISYKYDGPGRSKDEAIEYARHAIEIAIINDLLDKDPNTTRLFEKYTGNNLDTGVNCKGFRIKKYNNAIDNNAIIVISKNDKAVKRLQVANMEANFMTNQWKYQDITSGFRAAVVYCHTMDVNIRTEVLEYKSSGSILQHSIATWYKVFRRVALVMLLSILVYVGIRIMISSTISGKSKYKKMFLDWLVAVCILFVLQYIMMFILTISSNLTDIFVTKGNNIVHDLPSDTKIMVEENGELVEKTLIEYYGERTSSGTENYQLTDNGILISPEHPGYPMWMGDFVGYVRLIAGVDRDDNWTAVAYGLMYLVLVIYTCSFTVMYIKRVLYMAFLTMISPLVAVTYPLDKLNDGQAQAFGLWTKEYIFNALIQPLHLIIYTMTVSTVMDLAMDYPVYALIALGFITPAEQFLRKMFGFEKAGTVGTLGAMAGGAAVYSGIQKLSKLGQSKSKSEDDNEKPVRTSDKNGVKLPGLKTKTGITDTSSPKAVSNAVSEHAKKTAQTAKKATAKTKKEIKNLSFNKKKTPGTGSRPRRLRNAPNPATQKKAAEVQAKKKKKLSKRLGNGVRFVGSRFAKKLKKADLGKKAVKLTGSAVGAATVGMVGLAAGIASGDATKAFTYTTGGAGVGAAVGGNLAGNALDKTRETKEAFQKGYKGEKEYYNKKADQEYFKGEEFQEILQDDDIHPELKGRARTKAIKEEVQKYRSSGITDNATIMKGMTSGLPAEQAIWAKQLADVIGRDGWNNPTTQASFRDEWNESLGNSADDIWKAIELFL